MFDFGFIGCGHMGAILASAVKKAGFSVGVSNLTEELTLLAAQKTGAMASDNQTLAKNSRFLAVAVRPQDMQGVLREISPLLSPDTVIISPAAGVTVQKIQAMLGKAQPIIRIMPNTPAAVGEGAMLFTLKGVGSEQKDEFLRAFEPTGLLLELDEELIDSGCAVSGCGPAFVYRFIEHFAKAGKNLGLSEETSLCLAAQTVLGAAKMLRQSGKTAGELCDEVCSPGGATIEGVRTLDESDMSEIMKRTLTASFDRTKQLGRG